MSEEIKNYPALPLRDLVVFPNSVSSLFVGREKSMAATRAAMDGDRKLVLLTQKEPDTVFPQLEDVHEIGVICEILQLLKMPDGTFKILVEGLSRVVIKGLNDDDTMQGAEVAEAKTTLPQNDLEQKLLDKIVKDIILRFDESQVSHGEDQASFDEIFNKNNSEYTIDAVAHAIKAAYHQKQVILEELSLLHRAEKTQIALSSQLEMSELESDIHNRVKQQMDKMQRKLYLHEQMKAIREEMDEGDVDEFEDYKKRIQEKHLSDEIRTKAEQELRKLEKMPPMSAESAVVRNYLDIILDLPFNDVTEDNKDIKLAEEVLEKSHHGLEKVKERILEFIAVRQLAFESRGPILCLVGPPGVGKTSLAKTLASCLDRKFGRIALGGIRDEAEIRGHRRTYIGALPGRVITTLRKLKVKNPVILLDELDKISNDYRGNPAAALLEVLDTEQNSEFTDNYLELPFDLSQVLFIATANVVHSIPEPLLDRLELIELSSYTEHEKIQIANNFLMDKQTKENGIADLKIKYNDKSLAYIVRHYTKEAGVRQLERELAKIARKVARDFLQNQSKEQKYLLDKENLHKFLGPPKFQYGKKESEAAIGKCHGMAWTSVGGDILNVEVALAHGAGKLTITGNLGDVMKESASAAVGYLRSQAHLLKLQKDFFESTDIFIHVPEGAIPKDGPSAGITLATALFSAVTQIPVKNEVAMTGEITLRGKVLQIGGLKEKVLAAYRGGTKTIICPKDNASDKEEIPSYVTEKLEFHFVSTMQEVLELALTKKLNLSTEQGIYPFAANHLEFTNLDSTTKN